MVYILNFSYYCSFCFKTTHFEHNPLIMQTFVISARRITETAAKLFREFMTLVCVISNNIERSKQNQINLFYIAKSHVSETTCSSKPNKEHCACESQKVIHSINYNLYFNARQRFVFPGTNHCVLFILFFISFFSFFYIHC